MDDIVSCTIVIVFMYINNAKVIASHCGVNLSKQHAANLSFFQAYSRVCNKVLSVAHSRVSIDPYLPCSTAVKFHNIT